MKYVLKTGIVRELREIKDGLYWSTKGTNCKETYINWIETRKLNTNQKTKEESKRSITITLDLNKQQELLKRTKKALDYLNNCIEEIEKDYFLKDKIKIKVEIGSVE